jgi:hypothetical protein
MALEPGMKGLSAEYEQISPLSRYGEGIGTAAAYSVLRNGNVRCLWSGLRSFPPAP